jgi:hypothetical protein
VFSQMLFLKMDLAPAIELLIELHLCFHIENITPSVLNKSIPSLK